MRRKIIDCNIWMLCLELNWFFYDPSWMLQLSEFVKTLRSSMRVVFNNFLLIDARDKSKISSDQKRLFFAVSLYPLLFFVNTPFNMIKSEIKSVSFKRICVIQGIPCIFTMSFFKIFC